MHSKRRYKIVSIRSSKGNLSLFETTRASYYFPENFRCNFRFYESENFSDSFLNRIFESENVRFPFSTKNRLTWVLKWENYTLKNSREFTRYVTKIENEWNGHLEIFSLPQAIEHSRQVLLLRTDILQKTVFGCPWPSKAYVQHPARP